MQPQPKPVKESSASVELNERGEHAVVQISSYRGNQKFDVRLWYTSSDGELLPTQKGVSIPIPVAVEVYEAMGLVLTAAGLLPEVVTLKSSE